MTDRPLTEWTLEELWKMFPIRLAPHDERYAAWFLEERDHLLSSLDVTWLARISHVGSTAISTLVAKPVIDILVELRPNAGKDLLIAAGERIEAAGYLCMAVEENRRSYNKGYTPNGYAPKVFHLHLRQWGDHDELYFRDELLRDGVTAKEYEHLKLALAAEYEHDRDRYTRGKTEFVSRVTERGKNRFFGRYENPRFL